MNNETTEPNWSSKPQDAFEQVFWHLDKINMLRGDYYTPEALEPYVRWLGEVVERLYTEWLRAHGLQQEDGEPAEYLYLVLPYISFRLLNARGIKPVDLFKVTSTKKKKFIDCMVEELHELPDSPLLRVMMMESLNTLLRFLEGLRCRRDQ
jgi:hypothetical protein